MAAPSPDLIVTRPRPLNRHPRWPFRVDRFPASWLLGFAGLGRNAPPTPDKSANPNRVEDQ